MTAYCVYVLCCFAMEHAKRQGVVLGGLAGGLLLLWLLFAAGPILDQLAFWR